ncbi:putative transcriptional regulator [Hartmannibacter diazotrophicus]|uniref:Putative transcriptional regulator n=1 Tax=Hartmannibacter diazotrophicus TaxID=1482074 RepID=A0A2C9D6F6_9HYPH|nr:putative transcriptional regulator [Hartmannibacter diazotrophicus]
MWILFQLRLKGESFTSLARKIGCSQQAVTQVSGGKPSFEIEKAIAKELGVPHADLFPEHFDSAGERIPLLRTSQRKRSEIAKSRNVDFGEAC